MVDKTDLCRGVFWEAVPSVVIMTHPSQEKINALSFACGTLACAILYFYPLQLRATLTFADESGCQIWETGLFLAIRIYQAQCLILCYARSSCDRSNDSAKRWNWISFLLRSPVVRDVYEPFGTRNLQTRIKFYLLRSVERYSKLIYNLLTMH